MRSKCAHSTPLKLHSAFSPHWNSVTYDDVNQWGTRHLLGDGMVESIRRCQSHRQCISVYHVRQQEHVTFIAVPYSEHLKRIYQVHCAVFRCVGSSRNLNYVAFNFRKVMTLNITLFPDVPLKILVPIYQTTWRHVPQFLIFKISISFVLCYHMTYYNVCSQYSLFQKWSWTHCANYRAVTFTKCISLNHTCTIKWDNCNY